MGFISFYTDDDDSLDSRSLQTATSASTLSAGWKAGHSEQDVCFRHHPLEQAVRGAGQGSVRLQCGETRLQVPHVCGGGD